jgi:hypothetical protein
VNQLIQFEEACSKSVSVVFACVLDGLMCSGTACCFWRARKKDGQSRGDLLLSGVNHRTIHRLPLLIVQGLINTVLFARAFKATS